MFLYRFGIQFPDYRRYQDPPFLVRALYYSEKIGYISDTVYVYRFKKKNFNDSIKSDILKGLLDVLLFSKDKKLSKLHLSTVRRLVNDYFDRMKCSSSNNEVNNILKIFISSIDNDLLLKEYCTTSNIIYFNKRIKELIDQTKY